MCERERKGERRKKKEKLNLKKQGGACYNQIMNKSYIIEKLYMQLVINIVQFPICNCFKVNIFQLQFFQSMMIFFSASLLILIIFENLHVNIYCFT